MNLGGEPERDDSGLPPVDIEIPDDARELDRDVQAYRRELRALRRHQRRKRLHGPLTRDGVVLPLLASCLVFALIAGTLLTVFTAGPGGNLPGALSTATRGAGTRSTGNPAIVGTGPQNSGNSASAPTQAPGSQGDSPKAVLTGGKLPDKAIEIGGVRVPLRTINTPAVLALIPRNCACTLAVRQLVGEASAAGVKIYLVGGVGQAVSVRRLAARVPRSAIVADDVSGGLSQTYQHAGLMALLVHRNGAVGVAAPLAPGFVLSGQLQALAASAPQAAASPLPTGSSTAPPVR